MRQALRHPPAFRIDVAPDPAWQHVQAALYCLACGLAGLTVAQHLLGTSPSLLTAAWLGLAALAVYIFCWRRLEQACGLLRWDGRAWQWQDARTAGGEAETRPVDVAVAIDLGDWLLLRLRNAPPGGHALAGSRYLALAQRRHAATWPALRACLQATRR